jgi:hypothetical protein
MFFLGGHPEKVLATVRCVCIVCVHGRGRTYVRMYTALSGIYHSGPSRYQGNCSPVITADITGGDSIPVMPHRTFRVPVGSGNCTYTR